MKKNIIFLISLILINCSCGDQKDRYIQGKVNESQAYVKGKEVKLYTDKGNIPEWVKLDTDNGFDQVDGEKYFWIRGISTSKFLKAAKQSATIEAQSLISTSIKTRIYTQFADAWSLHESNQSGVLKSVKESISASKSKIDVSGLLTLGSFEGQIAYVEEFDKDSKPVLGDAIWKYYVKLGIPYDHYRKLRDQVLDEYLNRNSDDKMKVLVQKTNDILKKIDE